MKGRRRQPKLESPRWQVAGYLEPEDKERLQKLQKEYSDVLVSQSQLVTDAVLRYLDEAEKGGIRFILEPTLKAHEKKGGTK
jgi:hypothetical protein